MWVAGNINKCNLVGMFVYTTSLSILFNNEYIVNWIAERIPTFVPENNQWLVTASISNSALEFYGFARSINIVGFDNYVEDFITELNSPTGFNNPNQDLIRALNGQVFYIQNKITLIVTNINI